jgi:hypothetical protein
MIVSKDWGGRETFGNRKDGIMATYDVSSSEYDAEVLELMGLPRRGGYGNVIAMFDRLDSGEALLVVDNRDLTWILKLVKDVRGELLQPGSHAFEKPENYFLYLVKQ